MSALFDHEGMATAKMVFSGERFVSLPRVAEMMQAALQCEEPPRFEDVTLTSILVETCSEALLMGLDLMGDETVMTIGLRLPEGDTRTPGAVLAGVCHYLARNLPIAFVTWGLKGPRIPRTQFVEELADCFAPTSSAMVAQITPRRVSPVAHRAAPEQPPRVDIVTHYTSDIPSLREGDVRHDAHIDTYEEYLREHLRETVDCTEKLSTTNRLSAWAFSLSAATIALPVALPSLAYNAFRGEDPHSSAQTLAVAGTFAAITQSGALNGLL